MPIKPEAPVADNRIVRTRSGILLPPGASSRRAVAGGDLSEMPKLKSRIDQQFLGGNGYSSFQSNGFNYGLALDRDEETLIVCWAEKGSGLDDEINAALVDGEIANAGISPVAFPQITGLLKHQLSQSATAEINMTGRYTPVSKARDALSMADDSPLGITDFITKMTYQLRTYNRGAPVATVPISIPVEYWQSEYMDMVPLGTEKDKEYFYLDVDWAKRKVPIPYLPSVFDLEPTGNNEWPYWYAAQVDGKRKWVLLHHSHIIPVLPGRSSRNGVGTSSVYTCLGFLGEHILVVDERLERTLAMPTEGIVGISGVEQTSTEIKKKVIEESKQANQAGRVLSRPWTLLTTPADPPITFSVFSFRQPDGVDFEARRQYQEDILALAFEEPLIALVNRGGIGYAASAESSADQASDSGINSVLHTLGVVLGAIYPRVTFAVSRPNDLARQKSLERLDVFASAVQKLDDGTITVAEARLIINRDILDIPLVDEDTTSADATLDDNDPQTTSDGDNADDKEAQDDAEDSKDSNTSKSSKDKSTDEELQDQELDALLEGIAFVCSFDVFAENEFYFEEVATDEDKAQAEAEVTASTNRARSIAERITANA